MLDGDELRKALVPPPGYTPEARDAFYATLAYLAALLAGRGGVQVTRLARGLPSGSQLEYANKGMLADAIAGRQKMG